MLDLSDFYRNDPSQKDPFDEAPMPKGGANRWEQPDPFAAYHDPASGNLEPESDFSAWRRPETVAAPSFLTDAPAPYGAEMQQGGVPLYTLGAESPFGFDSSDAPTRIGMPAISQQMVSKRKTIDRGERPAFAPPPSEERMNPSSPDVPQSQGMNTAFAPLSPSTPAARPKADAPTPGRSRRAGRLARYQEEIVPSQEMETAAPLVEPALERRPRPVPMDELPPSSIPAPTGLDPFEAGDNVAEAPPSPLARRPALPGERYTGARTAIPQSGAPIPRRKVGALPDYDVDEPISPENKAFQARERAPEQSRQEPDLSARPQGMQGRPPQEGMQPQDLNRPPLERRPLERPRQERPLQNRPPQDGLPSQGRPAQGRPPQEGIHPQDLNRLPQERRPQEGMPSQGRPPQTRPPQERRPQDQDRDFEDSGEHYVPSRRGRKDEDDQYSAHASVNRPRYGFEDEDEFDDRPRRGCLMPILILLLVVGLLLAGICLPNWSAMEGGIAGALGGIKDSITGIFDTAKNMIFPVEEKITSFSVSPTDGTAPVELVFNVQTSLSVTDLRIVDDTDTVITQKTLTDADLLTSGDVTKNSKAMIWRLRCTIMDAYSGLYTVQSLQTDGTWDEGIPLSTPVSIAAPVVPEPPVQSYHCDTSEGFVPTIIGFTVQTSGDVVAVRVVDDYGMTVATHILSDGETQNASVVESAEGLTWELKASVNEPYEGNYLLQYQTSTDLSFTASEEGSYVELSEAVDPALSDDVDDFTAKGEPNADDGDEAVIAANADVDLNEDPDADADLDADPDENSDENPDADADLDADPDENPDADVQPSETTAQAAKPTPLPALTASADESAAPSAITLKATVYLEQKVTTTYSRTKQINLLDPFNYAIWDQSGVLTFRGGPLRQNAAYGTVQITEESLTELWKVPVGSMKLRNSTAYGIVWPGQPVIVKWPTEVRNLMKLNDEKKATTALKEVILGGQDGKIYFLDLNDGEPTRDEVDMGAPSSGGVSIATNGAPILGIGQSHANLASKTVNNGYHLFSLLTNKELTLLSSKEKAANSNYTGVSGAALFDKATGSMIVGSQNGLLYTAELGGLEDTFDYGLGTLKLSNLATQRYKTLAAKQDKKNTNIDGSVAMYNQYVYYGDDTGVLQCVDVNTLQPVWAVKTDDNIDATPALDFEESTQTLALYTGNTIQRQGKKGVCTIRRYDALTGMLDWEYQVPELAYTTEYEIGCIASPVVGENDISDLVIFTATNGKLGSTIIALKKSNGSVAWTTKMESESVSSPVAVYEDSGKAWILQAESSGNVHLIDAETGEIKNTLKLEGEIQGSPAVYKNIMVLGSTGKDTSFIYGIQLQ